MLVDGALAVLLCLHTGLRVLHHAPAPALMALLTGLLSLALRRRVPLLTLAVITSGFIAFAVLGGEFIPLPLAVLIAVYTVAASQPLWISASAAGAAFIGGSCAVLITLWAADDDVFDQFPLYVAAWVVGYGSRLSRAHSVLMEQLAARLAREQEARTRLAVLEEQSRIAREMHDIVSHHITVIVAQASAAARVVGRGSTVAPEILDTIASSGREALGELRRLLGALRPESQLPGSLPWPQLDHVPALIHQMERSGLPVELIVRGQPRPLPVSVELNAYRIIQEALTNALKHAGPTRTEVELDYQPTQLALRVSDDGSSPVDAAPAVPTPSTSGFGVLGMIHRVSLLGGRISMGPVTGHGFQVSACIPVPKG